MLHLIASPSGDFDIPDGWATVIAAAIPILLATIAGMVGTVWRRLQRIERSAREANAQVSNEYIDPDTGAPINLREELDGRHAELTGKLDAIVDAQHRNSDRIDGLARDIGGVRAELRGLHDADTELNRQQNRDRERLDGIARHRERTPP